MRQQFIKGYYFATPVLWLVDAIWGVNVRAAGFESYPTLKHFYFALCVGCAIAIWRMPSWSFPIGLTESFVNILSLILGVFGPYYKLIGSISEDMSTLQNPFSMHIMINFVFAGTAACISFYQVHGILSAPRRDPG